MRHSHSVPSLPSAEWANLATPRNLIEVSARLRSQELSSDNRGEPAALDHFNRSGCGSLLYAGARPAPCLGWDCSNCTSP